METKLKLLIEQLVYKTLKEAAPSPEADEEDPFGKYLFGQKRKLPEPDTEDESYFEKAFESFVLENMDNGLARFIPTLIELKNEGKYAQYLQPPAGKVWRIISGLSTSDAAKILNLNEEEMLELSNIHNQQVVVSPKTNFTYDSTYRGKRIASWTDDLESSDLEGFFELYENTVTVLLESNTSNGEFLFNPTNMKKIVSDEVKTFLETENEVMSVGKVLVTKAVFYVAPEFSDNLDDFDADYEPYEELINVMLGNN